MDGQEVLDIQEREGCGTVNVMCDLVVANAMRVQAQLAELAPRCNVMQLNLARTGEIDVSGVQLLVAAKDAMQAQGKTLEIIEVPPDLADLLTMLGLRERLSFQAIAGTD